MALPGGCVRDENPALVIRIFQDDGFLRETEKEIYGKHAKERLVLIKPKRW